MKKYFKLLMLLNLFNFSFLICPKIGIQSEDRKKVIKKKGLA